MYHPPLTKWRNPHKVKGLLFFATAVIDLLFDHTIDAFKASALNTHTRALEFRTLARMLTKGRSQPGAISPVLDELEQSIHDDAALSHALRATLLSLTSKAKLQINATQPYILQSLGDAMVSQLDTYYWNDIARSIVSLSIDEKEKKQLYSLANDFVSEVELRGYDRRHIYRTTKDFFFEAPDPPVIDSHDAAKQYISLFEQQPTEYIVVFKSYSSLGSHQELSEPFGLLIGDQPSKALQNDVTSDEERAHLERFLGVSERSSRQCFIEYTLSSLDPYTARKAAEAQLQGFVNVVSFEQHTAPLGWDDWVFVGKSDSRAGRVHRPLPNPMQCGLLRPWSPGSAEFAVSKSLIDLLTRRNFPTTAKSTLLAALEYHRSALRAKRPETQILDLWALIEGLCPSHRGDTSRVVHYWRYVEAATAMQYVERVLLSLSDAVCTVDTSITDMIDDWDITGSRTAKFSKIICCESLSDYRKQLYSMLDHHPLLKWRCFTFHKKLDTPHTIAKSIGRHIRRVRWQFERIYGLRNQIIHNASSLPYTTTLVENLHTYVDLLVNAYIRLSVSARTSVTSDGLLELLPVHKEVYLNQLLSSTAPISQEELFSKVLVTYNPLAGVHISQ